MKIAVFHNYYRQRGGEDVMFELECEALREQGHIVVPFSLHNEDEMKNASLTTKARVAWNANHNKTSKALVKKFLERENPDIGHVHNWFPLLSPSIYEAHNELGIPVVQTLHNYRLGCAAGTYRRNGSACELCRPGRTMPAVTNRCYKGSLAGSMAWARMVNKGWKNRTFSDKVSCYISPSREIANRHTAMGLPKRKMRIIPNASADASICKSKHAANQEGAVYIGRLVAEKGVDVLIKAWIIMSDELRRKIPETPTPTLRIIGTGPDQESLNKLAAPYPFINFSNSHLSRVEVQQAITDAHFLVFPSRWPEPFGLGVIEAMSAGRPVIASNTGGPAEIVQNGEDGLLVPDEDPEALAKAILSLLEHPEMIKQMGLNARVKYEAKYTPQVYATNLVNLFKELIR